MFCSSHFLFMVFGHFWSYENITQSLFTFCKARWTRRKKTGKKITKLMWSKYQKPKDKNMRWTKLLSGMSAGNLILENENPTTQKSKSGCYGNGIRSAAQQLIVVMNVAVAWLNGYVIYLPYNCSSVTFRGPFKGQIISEGIFLVLHSSKKQTRNVCRILP